METIFEYFKDVNQALLRTCVTDYTGKELLLQEGIDIWVEEAKKIKNTDRCIYFCGNGASATMAEHLSHDCFQNMVVNTYTCSEVAHITAISNDISYEDVFSYRISRVGKKGDMLVAISSSGNSPNIIKAIKAAREKEMFVVTLTGKAASNAARKMGSINFYVPLNTYGMVESAHAILLHSWLDTYMDKYIEGGRH